MSNSEQDPPGRLISHFRNRGSKQQSSGWKELWETDQSALWDRGKPSMALIEFIESKPQILSAITNKYRPKALVPGCGKGYDVVALALHGFDVYGLEISEKGAITARQYAAVELAEPSEYNFHDVNTWPTVDAGEVTIVSGDFIQKDWEPSGLEFDLIYDYTFLCALHPSLRQAWARRMHELLSLDGVLICLEFPLYKDLTLPGPPWGLKGVYWNLLAVGGTGIIDVPSSEEKSNNEGPFRRLVYFKPTHSYENGKGTDMLSVWSALPWQFPANMEGSGQGQA